MFIYKTLYEQEQALYELQYRLRRKQRLITNKPTKYEQSIIDRIKRDTIDYVAITGEILG